MKQTGNTIKVQASKMENMNIDIVFTFGSSKFTYQQNPNEISKNVNLGRINGKKYIFFLYFKISYISEYWMKHMAERGIGYITEGDETNITEKCKHF